jgi:hypothetical protein
MLKIVRHFVFWQSNIIPTLYEAKLNFIDLLKSDSVQKNLCMAKI